MDAVKLGERACAAQQKQFDAFQVAAYNTERPHDTLGGDAPASRDCAVVPPFPGCSSTRFRLTWPPLACRERLR